MWYINEILTPHSDASKLISDRLIIFQVLYQFKETRYCSLCFGTTE